jgi:hypothetical protein
MTGWHRPRGRRKIPPARNRAPADPYGSVHRRVRAALLAELAAIGGAPCPLCGEMMYAWMGRALHLHHSDPAAKLLGLPGDTLAHAACNLRDGGRTGASITNDRTATGGGMVTGGATVRPLRPAVKQSRVW